MRNVGHGTGASVGLWIAVYQAHGMGRSNPTSYIDKYS